LAARDDSMLTSRDLRHHAVSLRFSAHSADKIELSRVRPGGFAPGNICSPA
jgi:hypothetical protein